MIPFTIILFAWAILGFIGLLNCKKYRIMWELIIFMGLVPFIPLIAAYFKIL